MCLKPKGKISIQDTEKLFSIRTQSKKYRIRNFFGTLIKIGTFFSTLSTELYKISVNYFEQIVCNC